MPSLSDYHYELPEELIAQRPAARRDASRLMVVDRGRGTIEHRRFAELPELLAAGDLLVVNDTRVVPARVFARKETGGRVELLFHGRPDESAAAWQARCLTRGAKRLRPGVQLNVEMGAGAAPAVLTVEEVRPGGEAVVSGAHAGDGFYGFLAAVGELPLPPYIRRDEGGPDGADAQRYQTVFAREPGAVAAPTAGLHFTPEIFAELAARGVERAQLTLHVGPGTFQPVREDDYSRHQLLAETYELPEETARRVAEHRPPRGRVVAVGTTAVRTLEGAADEDGRLRPGRGETDIFLTPGYRFRAVDALVTNFHLPGSTLLLLVAALAGRDLLLEAYRQAVAERYRFYSYGDAMLIV